MEKEKLSMRRFSIWLGLGMLWVALTYIVCLLPPDQEPPVFDIPHLDKIIHCLIYTGLIWWFLQIYEKHKLVVIITFFFMGLSIEFLQPFFGRGKELADVFANSSGLLLGFILWKNLRVKFLHTQDKQVR